MSEFNEEAMKQYGVSEWNVDECFDTQEEALMFKQSVLPPVHPGEVLKEDFLKPLGISQYRLAKELQLSQYCISKIINGKSSISADTAVRLAAFFSTTPDLWMNLQKQYDVKVAQEAFDKSNIKIAPFRFASV